MKAIMIVDNEQPFHDFYSEMLKDTDYEVISAYDCYDALAKLREERPVLIIMDDLIFMDIFLDIMDSDDTLFNCIKRRADYETIPFVKTSELVLRSCKNLKKIVPKLLFPDKTFTRKKLIEEINARIGYKTQIMNLKRRVIMK